MLEIQTDLTRTVERFRQPEYTGENRCIPCTIVNVVIAAVLAAALAYLSIPIGIVAFVVFVGLIYLRGYLVPYTPTLTKRYFPDRVLRWFDKQPSQTQAPEEVEDIDVEQTLFSMGVITGCEDMDDLCVEPSFHEAWHERIIELRGKETREDDIAELLDRDGGDHEIQQFGNAAAVVMLDDTQVGQWESDAALIADLAADKVLRERTDDWADYHIVNRSQLLNSLRMFIERCPSCDAPVTMGQETVESCCRSMDVVAVSCDSCGSRIFELELTEELRQQV